MCRTGVDIIQRIMVKTTQQTKTKMIGISRPRRCWNIGSSKKQVRVVPGMTVLVSDLVDPMSVPSDVLGLREV